MLIGATLAGFIWNEARKEIVYLCANFTPGVSEQSVLSQLETGNFLHYERTSLTPTISITVDSVYNLGLTTCRIELDQNHRVVAAAVE